MTCDPPRPHRSNLLASVVCALIATTVAAAQSLLQELETEVAAVVEAVSPAVVTVKGYVTKNGAQATFVGSGLVADSLGSILTSTSVVVNADRIEVINSQGRIHPASLWSWNRTIGLAVLRAESLPPNHPIRFATDRQIKAGYFGIIVGNAYGAGASPTLTTIAHSNAPDGFMQLSAPAIPGNSGAPVFDSSGGLIGLVAGEVGDSDALGTAPRPAPAAVIPVTILARSIKSLPGPTSERGGWMGMTGSYFGEPGSESVFVITDVATDGPASRAGIVAGDRLTQVADRPFYSLLELRNQFVRARPGTDLSLLILRQNRQMTITVTVGSMPPAAVPTSQPPQTVPVSSSSR